MYTCEFVDIRCKILIWKLKDVVVLKLMLYKILYFKNN